MSIHAYILAYIVLEFKRVLVVAKEFYVCCVVNLNESCMCVFMISSPLSRADLTSHNPLQSNPTLHQPSHNLPCLPLSPGGQFWQITDIHWDWTYDRSGDASNWCHGAATDPDTDNGLFGNFNCDAPWTVVKEAVREMAQVQPQPDFVIWTG